VFFTYIDEPEAVEQREIVGVDNLMFATDYPHTASTWPHSMDVVERDTAALSAEERRKLIHDNTLRVFGIRSAVLA
jgi:predicted TIM-barrel fold metal-dependent hydrolase